MTKPYKALVVDDVVGWCEQLEEMLQDAGFQVSIATDKDSAMAALDNSKFDVAVIDVNLSDSAYDVGGLRINEHIQQHARDTRVILISARSLSSHELDSIRPAVFLEKSTIIQRSESLVEQAKAMLEASS